MKVTVNNKLIELPDGATLSDALNAVAIEPRGIAVALNDTVVPKDKLGETPLSDSDKNLIIKAFYGG